MAKAIYGFLGNGRQATDAHMMAEVVRLRARVAELQAQVAALEATMVGVGPDTDSIVAAPDDLTPLDALNSLDVLVPRDDSRAAFA